MLDLWTETIGTYERALTFLQSRGFRITGIDASKNFAYCWEKIDNPDVRFFVYADNDLIEYADATRRDEIYLALPVLLARARRADELEQVQRWIPVSERHPDEGELVQWYAPGNDDYSYSTGKLEGSSVCETGQDRYPLAIYSHWMPLPAPPEAE